MPDLPPSLRYLPNSNLLVNGSIVDLYLKDDALISDTGVILLEDEIGKPPFEAGGDEFTEDDRLRVKETYLENRFGKMQSGTVGAGEGDYVILYTEFDYCEQDPSIVSFASTRIEADQSESHLPGRIISKRAIDRVRVYGTRNIQ